MIYILLILGFVFSALADDKEDWEDFWYDVQYLTDVRLNWDNPVSLMKTISLENLCVKKDKTSPLLIAKMGDCLEICEETKEKVAELFVIFWKHLKETHGAINPENKTHITLRLLPYMSHLDSDWLTKEKKWLLEAFPSPGQNIDPLLLNGSFETLPPLEMWRLFVDGQYQISKQENGWNGYESREPGCIRAMIDSFKKASEAENPLSFDLYEQIHHLAAVHFEDERALQESMFHVRLVPGRNVSVQGLLEVMQPRYQNWFEIYTCLTGESAYEIRHVRGKDPKEIARQIIEDYQARMALDAEMSPLDKLKAIIQLSSDLDRLHLYGDANCRTAMIIALRECQRNGLPLFILFNPNRLDAYSQEELVWEFLNGMARYRQLVETGTYEGLPKDLTTSELLKNLHKPDFI